MVEQAKVPAKPDVKANEARSMAAILEHAKVLDLELERQQRLYRAAHSLREQCDATMQQYLSELQGLEARRDALAHEVGALEARKVTLAGEVAQATKAQR